MIRVYFALLPDKEPPIPEELLSAYRKEKLAGQTNRQIRIQSLGSELLLRHALEDCGFPLDGALDIVASELGKPALLNGACRFSLSHSAGGILCALCDREIGADIQVKTGARTALIRRCLTADEQDFIRTAADPDAAFSEIWTKKESFCKRDGRGLVLSLSSFSVFDREIEALFWHETAGEYHMALCCEAAAEKKPELTEVKTSVLFP